MERFSLKNNQFGEICPESSRFYQNFPRSHQQSRIRRRDISFAILCTAACYYTLTG